MIPAEEDAAGSGTLRGCRFSVRLDPTNFRGLVLGGGGGRPARSRLYRSQILQVNMRSTAFFKIYQILSLNFLKFDKILQILQILRHLQFFLLKFHENR